MTNDPKARRSEPILERSCRSRISSVSAPADAVAWADSLIAVRSDLPTPVFDLSVILLENRMSVLDTLGQLTDIADVTERLARALLDVLGESLRLGAVTVNDAFAAAYRLTHPLGPGCAIWGDALTLKENYALARDGIAGSLDVMDAEIWSWLAEFRGSMPDLSAHAV